MGHFSSAGNIFPPTPSTTDSPCAPESILRAFLPVHSLSWYWNTAIGTKFIRNIDGGVIFNICCIGWGGGGHEVFVNIQRGAGACRQVGNHCSILHRIYNGHMTCPKSQNLSLMTSNTSVLTLVLYVSSGVPTIRHYSRQHHAFCISW